MSAFVDKVPRRARPDSPLGRQESEVTFEDDA